MKIIYPYFENSTIDYARLRNVFEKSARRHMPEAELVCINLEPAKFLEDKHDLTTRAFLAKTQAAFFYSDNMLVCDCDMFFTDSVNNSRVFDTYRIGITTRPDYKYPYNTGIFFVSDLSNGNGLDLWERNTKTIYANSKEKQSRDLIKAHGGVDQAAIYLTHNARPTYFKELPCRIYNACQGDWKQTTDETKVYHIKSGLRKIVLDPKKEHGELYLKAHPRVQEIARMWWAEEDR